MQDSLRFWNGEAATFDDEPDHGLRDPLVLAAWTALLKSNLAETHTKILDIGCGTGSLSVVLANLGHTVTAIDFSPQMIASAETKATERVLDIEFHVMDASRPTFIGRRFDAIVCRHLLWALPNLAGVLAHWVGLLNPGGRLLLIEGYWQTGGGLHAEQIMAALPASVTNIKVQDLSHQAAYWGQTVDDERYMVSAELLTS